jgi:hypothetical protein
MLIPTLLKLAVRKPWSCVLVLLQLVDLARSGKPSLPFLASLILTLPHAVGDGSS